MTHTRFTLILPLLLITSAVAQQPPAKSDPDVLTFVNGEKLIGHLVRSDGSTVTFHSDSMGDIKVDWSKIQELRAAASFVAVPKGIILRRHSDVSKLAKGPVIMTDKTLNVDGQKVPVADTGFLLPQPGFENSMQHSPGFFHQWKGTVTAGAALVQATQQSRSYTSAVSLIRTTPSEDWMDARDRTTFNFSVADGSVKQPGQPTVKTNILHADAERDQYLTGSHAYLFGVAAFDHNFSQGLDLQQLYGGGFGWTIIKMPNQTLDLKGSMNYERQSFQVASADHNLIGSQFSEVYLRKFAKGMVFAQGVSFTPAWNEASAYSFAANAGLTMPVYKRLAFSVTTLDTFLNDPPPGFKKNSFQLTMGLTYSLNK